MPGYKEGLLLLPYADTIAFEQPLAPSGCYLDHTKLPLLPDETEDTPENLRRRRRLMKHMAEIHLMNCMIQQLNTGGESLPLFMMVGVPSFPLMLMVPVMANFDVALLTDRHCEYQPHSPEWYRLYGPLYNAIQHAPRC